MAALAEWKGEPRPETRPGRRTDDNRGAREAPSHQKIRATQVWRCSKQNRAFHSGHGTLSAALLENTRLAGENYAQQRRGNLEMAVIFDEAEPAELVHEKAGARRGWCLSFPRESPPSLARNVSESNGGLVRPVTRDGGRVPGALLSTLRIRTRVSYGPRVDCRLV